MLFTRPRKISEKLNWLQYFLIIGFILIAAAYFTQVLTNNSANIKTNNVTKFELLINRADINLNNARKKEIEFFQTLNENLIDELSQDMRLVYSALTSSLTLSPNKTTTAVVKEIHQFAKQYEDAFQQATAIKLRLGLDENTGFQGDMRKTVHNIETLLNNVNSQELKISMLTMRRHEKDFILRGTDKYTDRMEKENVQFTTYLKDAEISQNSKKKIAALMSTYQQQFIQYVNTEQRLTNEIQALHAIADKAVPLLDSAISISDQLVKDTKNNADKLSFWVSVSFIIILLLISSSTISSVLKLSKGLRQSLLRLSDTVQELTKGNYSVRNELDTNDELGDLAMAFDNMLDDRMVTLANAEKENEQLNNSIIELMDSVADLSNRDLTVTASVAEDITGPVADAVNMMATETASVLKEIQTIAADVATATVSVKNQGIKVSDVAKKENIIVSQTKQRLEQASRTMNEIATLAHKCNEIGIQANESTSLAMSTVNDSAQGMNDVRQTISESEKRIKRLGERSQEISSVIEIINNIAERTQVLALNASMQAAAAGDAGRGFAVVANEVQRLAESSRQSTSEIEALVRNIQTETADAMLTMNKTIELIVNGADLATKAGNEMTATQKTTSELVNGVKHIAKRSLEQMKMSDELQQQATILFEGSLETGQELGEQSKYTDSLANFSKRLVQSVSVFKLPA